MQEVIEWRCDECKRPVIRGQSLTRYGMVVCSYCVVRGIVSHLTAIRSVEVKPHC